MGRLRLLLDAALRDVVLMLHRGDVPNECVHDVRGRISKLLVEVIRYEEHLAHQQHNAPTSVMCQQIIHDIVDDVAGSICLARENEKLKREADEYRERIEKLSADLHKAQIEVSTLEGNMLRYNEAHQYGLESYFKEVLALRKRNLVAEIMPFVAEAQNSNNHTQVTSPGGSNRNIVRKKSLEVVHTTLQSPMSMDGDSTVVNSPSASLAGDETPLSKVGATSSVSIKQHRGASSTSASCDELQVPPEVIDYVNGDAVFDYTKYVRIQQSISIDLQVRYRNLQEEFQQYKDQVRIEKDKSEAHFNALVRNSSSEQQELCAQIAELTVSLKQMKKLVHERLNGLRGEFEPLRSAMTKAQVSIDAMGGLVGRTAASMHLHTELLVNYITAACHFMTSQSKSDAQDTFSRAAFQRSLAADDKDDEPTRLAKVWWRRHNVTGTVLSTIVAVRKSQANYAEISNRMKILSMLPQTEVPASPGAGGQPGRQKVLFSEAAQLGTNFDFLHKLFRIAGDPHAVMDPKDRQVILEAAKTHKDLSHARSKAIFDRVDARIRHNGRLKQLDEGFDLTKAMSRREMNRQKILKDEQEAASLPNSPQQTSLSLTVGDRKIDEDLNKSVANAAAAAAKEAAKISSGSDGDQEELKSSTNAHSGNVFFREVLLKMTEGYDDNVINSQERCALLRAKMVENATHLLSLLDRNLVRRVSGNKHMPKVPKLSGDLAPPPAPEFDFASRSPHVRSRHSTFRSSMKSDSNLRSSLLHSEDAHGRSSVLQSNSGAIVPHSCSLHSPTTSHGASGDDMRHHPQQHSSPPDGEFNDELYGHAPDWQQQFHPGGVLKNRDHLNDMVEVAEDDEILMVVKGMEPQRTFIVPTTGGIGPPEVNKKSLTTLTQSKRTHDLQRKAIDRLEVVKTPNLSQPVSVTRQRRHDSSHGTQRVTSAAIHRQQTELQRELTALKKGKRAGSASVPSHTRLSRGDDPSCETLAIASQPAAQSDSRPSTGRHAKSKPPIAPTPPSSAQTARTPRVSAV